MVVLQGAFLEIAVVTNYGDATTEAETVLGQTTEDVEIERDTEDAEWQEHNDPNTKRRELHSANDLTFEAIVTDDQKNLIDAGILDATTGRVRRNVEHEAVYIHVYEHPTSDVPAATYEMLNVQFKFETMSLPLDGPGTVEITGWINGEHGFQRAA